ncbi:hypothetical protein C8F01DRAFT_1252934 [Mycena amicta]|nr:hypothetical protein C8F01DRAFT_1252934 [Mycena amicta]
MARHSLPMGCYYLLSLARSHSKPLPSPPISTLAPPPLSTSRISTTPRIGSVRPFVRAFVGCSRATLRSLNLPTFSFLRALDPPSILGAPLNATPRV